MKQATVYAAVLPSGAVYVGRTVAKLSARRRGHFMDARRRRVKTPFQCALLEYGKAVQWRVLAVVGAEFADDTERMFIAEYKAAGVVLLNQTDGGVWGAKLSAESRAKISSSQKGKPSPMLGRKHTAATRAQMTKSHKERWARK